MAVGKWFHDEQKFTLYVHYDNLERCLDIRAHTFMDILQMSNLANSHQSLLCCACEFVSVLNLEYDVFC